MAYKLSRLKCLNVATVLQAVDTFQEVIVDSDVFVLGQDGILTDETCAQVLKVNFIN